MGKTMTEKIIGEHAGKEVKAGDIVVAKVDVAMVQDGTGPLSVQVLREMGMERVFNRKNTILFLDHATPSPRKELSNAHKILRSSLRRQARIFPMWVRVCVIRDLWNLGPLRDS